MCQDYWQANAWPPPGRIPRCHGYGRSRIRPGSASPGANRGDAIGDPARPAHLNSLENFNVAFGTIRGVFTFQQLALKLTGRCVNEEMRL